MFCKLENSDLIHYIESPVEVCDALHVTALCGLHDYVIEPDLPTDSLNCPLCKTKYINSIPALKESKKLVTIK